MKIPFGRLGWGLRPSISHRLPGEGGADAVALATLWGPAQLSHSGFMGLGRLAPEARKIQEAGHLNKALRGHFHAWTSPAAFSKAPTPEPSASPLC